MWQSAGRLPAARRAITPGSSSKRDSPVTSASNAGSRSRSSARASRSAAVRRALAGRRDRPDLAGAEPQPARVERAAEREPHLGVAVPAELEHRALGREQVQRALEPGRRRARVHDQVAAAGGVVRLREADAERGRDLGPRRVHVDERDLDRREAGQQAGDAAADHPGADDGDAVADQRGRVPERVDRRLDGAGEHRARGRHVVGHDGHGAGRHDVRRLVRVQAEDRAAAQLRRAVLDGADAEVAVLDRPREVALLERRPHRRVLARRHAAPEHQRLGAAADARAQRPDQDVAAPRLGQRDRPDLSAPRRAEPERVRVVEHVLYLAAWGHRYAAVRAGAATGSTGRLRRRPSRRRPRARQRRPRTRSGS